MTRLNRWLRGLPVHVILLGLCAAWLIPALGLFVTSFRPFQDVNESGCWTVLSPPTGSGEYNQYCAGCHSSDCKKIPGADLTSADLIGNYLPSFALTALMRSEWKYKPVTPHIE